MFATAVVTADTTGALAVATTWRVSETPAASAAAGSPD
jgi:hypothetical protein